LNSDNNENLAAELGVRALPTVIAFKNGQRVGEPLVGFRPENDLSNFIQQKLGVTKEEKK
jgi:thioredoxin-like negative regulator of GroEL